MPRKEYYARKLAQGLCALCYDPRPPGSRYCNKCLSSIRRSQQRRHLADREAALARYGDSCAFCGENYRPFLTIDHINNDGNAIRVELNGRNSGMDVYRWLRRHNYPDNVRVLCYNCNCAKSRVGEQELLAVLSANNRLVLGEP